MGIGSSINRAMAQMPTQQPMQQPSAPSSIGGKGGSALRQVQPNQSAFGTQDVQQPTQMPQPMGGKGAMQAAVQPQPSQENLQAQYPQVDQNQRTQADADALALQAFQQTQQPMQQVQQPYMQPAEQRLASMQSQMQPTMNPAVQNILRRSRGLGGKGMR